MKKFVCSVMVVASLFGLVSCGAAKEQPQAVVTQELHEKVDLQTAMDNIESNPVVAVRYYEDNHGEFLMEDAQEARSMWDKLIDLSVAEQGEEIDICDGTIAFVFIFEDGTEASISFSTTEYFSKGGVLYKLENPDVLRKVYRHVHDLLVLGTVLLS